MTLNQPRNQDRDLIHSISTPLTNVCLQLEYLIDQKIIHSDTLSPTLSEIKKIFSFLHHRESRVIENINFYPVKMIKQLLTSYQKPYNVVCSYHYPEKNIIFHGNPDHFEAIVIHLLNNAAEAYCCNRTNREINIDIVLAAQGLSLIISDHGEGIPWYKKHLIKFKGISFKKIKSGLGLHQVNQLIKHEFDGKLKIISLPYYGTMAIAYFPLY